MPRLGPAGSAMNCGAVKHPVGSSANIIGGNRYAGTRKLNGRACAHAYSAHLWRTFSSHEPIWIPGGKSYGDSLRVRLTWTGFYSPNVPATLSMHILGRTIPAIM